jgi:SAM-dependent methyltransferase/tetratricopeptide (TPR) repeat protein
MNRKQRRAAAKHGGASAVANDANALFAQAVEHQRQRRLDDAVRAYKRVLTLKPNHAEAANNLGCVLQLQGRSREASAAFAHALELAPELANDFAALAATVAVLVPAFEQVVQRAAEAWPQRPALNALLPGASLAEVAADPLLLSILKSTPVRDVAIERALTAIRSGLLQIAVQDGIVQSETLGFCAALAQQCFVNEYVFATTGEEDAHLVRLKQELKSKLAEDAAVQPLHVAAVAMYMPLHRLGGAERLPNRKWPQPVADVIDQQVREPRQELALRASIPALTPITDEISKRVREQYEDNPYPRWVRLAAGTMPLSFERYLSDTIPGASFARPAFGETVDVLVAGCGTGAHPMQLARKIGGSRVLAIDLSLSSLAYAKRKTPPDLTGRIEYAQADILKLGTIARSFDVIDSSGVLHHMAEPVAGLRVLLSLLRPGGFVRLGLYSQVARREISAARQYLAERGYGSSAEDIRRARQDILASDYRGLVRSNDFFTTSECRDLLFHVQEQQMTLPQIKAMLPEHGLRFIGFEFDPASRRRTASAFAAADKSLSDLDAWNEFEQHHPDTFGGMYQFWSQKL